LHPVSRKSRNDDERPEEEPMSRTDCPSPETLAAYTLGDLPEAELSAVAEHLDHCTDCEEQASRLDGMADPVVSQLRRLPNSYLDTDEPHTELARSGETAVPITATGSWGEFRIVREIGRGGMGVVYEAYQGSLNRHVALKFLPEQGDLARFRREARATGRLHHTNIVPVFGVGAQDGRHFYVMQFIAGRGLDVVLKERAGTSGSAVRFDDRETARIGVQVAEALAYAHLQGVVHRDIKPSNLLLDDQGTVWVTDFGLAHDASDTLSLTQTGDVLGTWRYLAPERFSGRGDERTDIYGLGITLYELVCGRPAYAEADRSVLVHQILHQDPPRPRQIHPAIARDLETIVVKATEREPGQRYATAEALAEDLRRFLEDRTILARRVGAGERAWRWCRRNPGLAGASVLSVVALVAMAATALAFALYQARNAHQQTLAAGRELALRKNSEVLLARVALKEGVSQCEQNEIGHGLLWLARALEFAPTDEPDLQREIRLNIDRWSRSTPRLRYAREFRKRVTAVAISPDGSRALVGSEDATARVWDLASGRPVGRVLWHGGPVLVVAFSPDGKLALAAGMDSRARLWNADTGEEVGPVLDHGGPIETAAFSPDGRHLATAGPNRSAQLWDLSNGHSVALKPRPEKAGTSGETTRCHVRFAPDGTRLITTRIVGGGGHPATSQLWAVPSGAPIGPEMKHDAEFVFSTTFDPEGKRVLAVGNDGAAWLWDAATSTRKSGPFRHLDAVTTAAFSPDGRLFATGCADGSACVWNPATLEKRVATFLHPQRCSICRIAFRDDGRQMLSAGGDGVARLWDPVEGRPLGGPCFHPRPLACAAMDPGGRWIVTGGDDGVARVWESPTTVSRLPAMSRANWGIRALAYSPDGSTILTGNDVGDVLLWDANHAVAMRPPFTSPGQILSVAFSPDNRLYAAAGRKQPVRIFDRQTSRLIRELAHPADLTALAFRPDDGALLAGGEDGTARLWDLEHDRPIGPDLVHCAAIRSVAISPDSRLAVTAGDDGRALIWKLGANQRLSSLEHPAKVLDVTFAARGTALFTGCEDGKARLWDIESQRLLREFVLGRRVNAVAASPDGRTLAAGGVDRTVSFWDAAGHLLDQKSERQSGFVLDLAYRPDGQAIAIGLGDGTTGLADVAYPVEGGIDELRLWSQVTSNARLDDKGNLVRLDHSAWSDAQHALAAIQSRSPANR
jgi:eukaryotic-like serine/threonine-protein kinase